MVDLDAIDAFDWDEGNVAKLMLRHEVLKEEAEQVFFNKPLLLFFDEKHSQIEKRFQALGRTNDGRLLHITFTLRKKGLWLRPISARPMNKKERIIYEESH